MYSTLPENASASLRSMIGIEARRFARHPVFLVGCLAAYGVMVLLYTGDAPYANDMLSQPVVPAFFIGLTSLVTAARLVRSTEVSDEAIGTAPGTEARRTLAVAGACVVPLVAGLVWLAELFVLIALKGPHENEWWFGTMNDLETWTLLMALGPLSCLGGGLLGVLIGRWLRFRGAPAVAVVALVAIDLFGQMLLGTAGGGAGDFDGDMRYRLWVPWALFHTGTASDNTDASYGYVEGSAALLPGNVGWYLLYQVALCALAVGGAVWHDRTARTARLRIALYGVIALAVAFLALAMFTGPQELRFSEPLPWYSGD